MSPFPLPEVLAGPMLRRTTRDEVCVWLATSVPAAVAVEVGRAGPSGLDEVLARADAVSVTYGPHLHVHLARARPAEPLPVGELLAYDVMLETVAGDPAAADTAGAGEGGAGPRRLADLGLVGGEHGVTYGDAPLPAFALPSPGDPLRILHGSCRLLHGAGEDAFGHVDALLAEVSGGADSAPDLDRRPQALLLTGDQIYGDEVGGPIIRHLGELGRALLGEGDSRSVPGVDDLAEVPVYGRQAISCERAQYTSGNAANHIFTLGEYAAAYLVAWNADLWPDRLPTADEAGVAGASRWETTSLRRQYRSEARGLETARTAVPAARRALANLPTYTVFDDHDVTDDWNITRRWVQRVEGSPTGRRAVANALAAFWAFQGWGNQPEAFDQGFRDTLAAGAQALGDPQPGEGHPAAAYEKALWGFDRWAYLVPTTPPVVMLDTRTQRCFDSDEGAARLLSDAELARVAVLCRAAVAEGGPLVLVSAVPAFGLEVQERRQKFLAGKVGPYDIDFEAWHSNLEGLVRFMAMLAEDVGVTRTVILSGDVHYALNVDVSFDVNGHEVRLAQLVSSSFKHSGTVARTLLHMLGRAVRSEQARVGWDAPPSVEARAGLAAIVDPLLSRSVNSDEWRDNAPVFLREALADRVDGDEPVYRERRRYVGPAHRPYWYVIGENNAGLVTVTGNRVRHQLLIGTDPHGRPRTWEATIDLDTPWAPEGE